MYDKDALLSVISSNYMGNPEGPRVDTEKVFSADPKRAVDDDYGSAVMVILLGGESSRNDVVNLLLRDSGANSEGEKAEIKSRIETTIQRLVDNGTVVEEENRLKAVGF